LTPIEGCSPRTRAAPSKTPEQLLELLNDRLPSKTQEGDDSPLSVDMTPAPVVIGVDASVDSSGSQAFFTRKKEIPSAP
jgi:hypothetical protein